MNRCWRDIPVFTERRARLKSNKHKSTEICLPLLNSLKLSRCKKKKPSVLLLSQSQHVFSSQSLKFSPKPQSHIYWLQLSLCRRSVHLFDTLGLNQTAAEDAPEISLSFISCLLEFALKCLVDTVAQGRCGWTPDKWMRKQFKLSSDMMSHSRAVQM